MDTQPRTFAVAVIGAGFSGIASAIKLREAGITDFVILERADSVGGTWRDAIYPGAEVDVPSWLYSLSFAPNPDWSSINSPASEILSYIEAIVSDFGLASHLRFGTEVSRIEFEDSVGTWRISCTDRHSFTARVVIAADGLLSNAQWPDLPGRNHFTGKQIHSARWEREYDFTGKRVAIIGTGASAVQIIPELVKTAEHVTVFQRTPAWVIPRLNLAVPRQIRNLFRRFPIAQRGVRSALFCLYESLTFALVWVTPLTTIAEAAAGLHLSAKVRDRELRRQLRPGYRIGCKRPLISSTFYPALQRDNVTLVPQAATEITHNAVRAANGDEHSVDCIVYATGYSVGRRGSSFEVLGANGQSLSEQWAHGMTGYKSVNVAGFPNLFWTMGPNAFGHSSELLFIEEQVRYAVRGIQEILNRNLRVLDVKSEAQHRHNRELQRKLRSTTFGSGCHSWYLSENGYNGMMFPGSVTAYRRQMSTFALGDYVTVAAIATTLVAEDISITETSDV